MPPTMGIVGHIWVLKMVNSINTNSGSLLGVSNLQGTKSLQSQTQEEISSGKKINGPEDSAAILAVAQLLESDIFGLNSVKDSLDRAISSTDVAISAGDEVNDLLLQLKEKAVTASDPGLDDASRQALNTDFIALRDQITSIVDSAEFNGTNAVKSGGDDITAISTDTGDGVITVDAQDLSLGGANVTLTDSQTIGTLADAQAAVTAIEDSITNVTSALSELGSGASELQATKDFTERLSDVTEVGIGNLVDANLASASASFEAGRVKEALGIQSLSIANQQPASILGLFENS